ncbi:MAG: SDR family NAD(P)-dependent oxidoreductase [Hyphomicrobiales bacterium]|nr:SDR family NAD(P)-dependent oxidoreductase [Hyphomicrobiales bacterium]
MDFRDRAIVVTGAAGNLGRAVATELAGRGAALVCVDFAAAGLAALEEALPGAKIASIAGLDLTKIEDAQQMAARAREKFGRIDGLVNTIGGFRMAPVGAEALKDWDFLVNLNARAVLATSAAVLPAMVERDYGRIVHIAAGAGHRGAAQLAVYSAAKAAVMRIVESIAEEHRDTGITANCILPGTIDTPQNRAAMPDADTKSWTPPGDIAKAIAFLLSHEAGAITGAAIPVTQRIR